MAIFNFDSDNILMIGDSKYIMNYSEVEDRYTLENEINQNDWLINESVSRWMKIPF